MKFLKTALAAASLSVITSMSALADIGDGGECTVEERYAMVTFKVFAKSWSVYPTATLQYYAEWMSRDLQGGYNALFEEFFAAHNPNLIKQIKSRPDLVVRQAYSTLFKRPVDGGGLAYWEGQIKENNQVNVFSVSAHIAGGAQNADKTALDNSRVEKALCSNWYWN